MYRCAEIIDQVRRRSRIQTLQNRSDINYDVFIRLSTRCFDSRLRVYYALRLTDVSRRHAREAAAGGVLRFPRPAAIANLT